MRHRTIRHPVELAGVGIHTGERVRVRLLPSEAPGVWIAPAGGAAVLCNLDTVSGTLRGVSVAGVLTVEHLLAAAWTLGVTALRVVVEGPEIPIGDGSALPFVELLRTAGTEELEAEVPELRLPRPVWVRDGVRVAAALPDDHLRVTYVVPLRDRNPCAVDVVVTEDVFVAELAPARTWGYAEDADSLRAEGRGRGASLENTLVLERGRFINPPRVPDEPARHKVVDLLGDLALLGARVHAHVLCVGAGHALHVALARAIRLAVAEVQRIP